MFEVAAYIESAAPEQLELCQRFREALGEFEREHWHKAESLFEKLLERFPDDRPSRLYLDRCREYAARPPEFEPRTAILLDTK